MTTSRAIKKPKRDDTQLSNWQPMPERAPSVEVADRPFVGRILAMVGLFLLVLGVLAMLAPNWQRAAAIAPGYGFMFACLGTCLLLYHAFIENDFQFRRLYGFLGLALAIGGFALRAMAFKSGYMSWFVFYGLPGLLLGLVLLVAVIRQETDAQFRKLLLNIVGGLGAGIVVYTCVRAMMRDVTFLAGEGAVLYIVGLLYVSAYIGQQEPTSERGHRAALGLGAVGLLGFAVGLIRSVWPESTFLVPDGLILMGMSLLYIVVAMGVCIDWPVIVLARRELASYFLSPVGFLVFIGQLLCAWAAFYLFIGDLTDPRSQNFEPIIGPYFFNLFPVMVQTLLVPALTMRLMSEEKRSGTLEVLLTAPVNEVSVVAGKFLACWIFYLLLWVPFWLFLISLRYVGGEEFDYRPALSFGVALAATSAGFVSMGLFFSSLTSNQIIGAVFTFVAMLAHLVFYFLRFRQGGGGAFGEVLGFINYFDFWYESLQGTLAPRLILFHVSVAAFFLFISVKLLESRKWK